MTRPRYQLTHGASGASAETETESVTVVAWRRGPEPDAHGWTAGVVAAAKAARISARAPTPAVGHAFLGDGTLVDLVGADTPGPDRPRALPVFVYGTLLSGEERHGAVSRAAPGARIEPATTRGALVHLGAWPGLRRGADTVHGELVRPRDLAELASLLGTLDPIEDFVGFEVEPHEYVREPRVVRTPAGEELAWAYRYVGPATRAVPIPSGRWRDAPRRLRGFEGYGADDD